MSFGANDIEDDQDTLGQPEQSAPDDADAHQGDKFQSTSAQLKMAQQSLHECRLNSKALWTDHSQQRAAEEAEKGNATLT